MVKPLNGLFLTEEDLSDYNDYVNEVYGYTIDETRNITFIVTESCNLNCSYCMEGNTEITMADLSKKKIKDIKIGDEILGFDEYPSINGNIETKVSVVEQLFHRKSNVIGFIFDDDTKIITTPNHPILSIKSSSDKNFTYKRAKDFKVLDRMYVVPSERKAKVIKSIIESDVFGEIDVYNLGTTSKTYIANDIAVHNCYEKNKKKRKMTKEVAKKAIDMIFDENKLNGYFDPKKIKCFILDFIGGEPFLATDIIDYATDYFKFKSLSMGHPSFYTSRVSISSNGVLYRSKEVQDYLKKNSGMISLGISVDGNKELHDSCRLFRDGRGSYDLAADALKDLRANNEHMSTKMTLAPENVKYTFEAIKSLYEDIGLHFVFANCVFEEGWTKEHAQILYDELIKLADWIIDNNLYDKFYCSLFSQSIGSEVLDRDKNWCGGDGSMLAIGVDGDCYPCLRYAPMSLVNREPLIIGNVDDGLLTTVEQRIIFNHLGELTFDSQSSQKCKDCKISSGCAWCSGYNYDKFGDANIRATFICDMHHARVCANHYFWNKLYKKLNIDEEFKLNCENCFEGGSRCGL